MERITLCGDDCLKCPRYLAKSDDELMHVAELWYRTGWRDRIVSADEIRCTGCDLNKQCTYQLVDCVKKNGVKKCSQCSLFPCDRINSMLAKSNEYKERCKEVCTEEEYMMLEKAFFNKKYNLGIEK